ncbi:MAG: sulfite exporter TauE/SafE family protein [Alphaproteobacteria bacterium]|jgi:uncharacterized protein|nr:sulfite exporter TauE/SafE family protein [Alphaproteobacteria bacterium]
MSYLEDFHLITDPLFYAIALPAIMIAGISKGGFGGGLVVMAVPLMALVVSPQQAAAVMLPILMAMDVAAVWAYRRTWRKDLLVFLLPAAVIGIIVGWASFGFLDASFIRLLLGTIAIVFTLDFWLRRGVRTGPVKIPDRLWGGMWAAIGGVTSFVAHAGGPPLNVYLLPKGLDKRQFVGTVVMFFAGVNLLKLVPYAMLGQFHTANLMTSLVLLPLAPAGIWLGLWLQNRVPDRAFYNVCYVLLFLTGCKLGYDGVTGVMAVISGS